LLNQIFDRVSEGLVVVGGLFAIAPIFVWVRVMHLEEQRLKDSDEAFPAWSGNRLATLSIRAYISTIVYVVVVYLAALTQNYLIALITTLVATSAVTVPWVPYWRALRIELRLPQSPKPVLWAMSSVGTLAPLWFVLMAAGRLVFVFGGVSR
jgi:hypothetical protein